ncbi:MAG: hypothetical protein ABR906_07225 [Terracidiphilus sp.]|jgi:hypothetical protein
MRKTIQGAQKNLAVFQKSSARGHDPAFIRTKNAVSRVCSEQDDSASGFAWVAREPQLIFGAEGRASSQRLSEYHILPWFHDRNPAKKKLVERPGSQTGIIFPLLPPDSSH